METKYKNVYVVCPFGAISGGPETLHQICDGINKQKICKAYILYIENDKIVHNASIPKCYSKYNVSVADGIEDTENNLIIVPETNTSFLKCFKRIKKHVCWLSLTYYFPYKSMVANYEPYLPIFFKPFLYVLAFLKRPFKFVKSKRLPLSKMKHVGHSYNTDLTKLFLFKKGITSDNYLCGPLSDDYFLVNESNVKKTNIITFNPKKGYFYTKKIIKEFLKEYGNKYTFVPIKNMTNKEVLEALSKSKLYIDFGYFPGPERLPRQAVMCHTNILVSFDGAAKFDDVPIPNKFKCAIKKTSIKEIAHKMMDMLENHEKYDSCFDSYRLFVTKQKEVFLDEISSICFNQPFEKPSV